MDSYIIQVQPRDELTVLIDKLIHTQAERVYLLVPDSSRIAQHSLNFRLLKREADSLGKEIVVVSSSPRVQNLALKSQLQAHQETHELKESASREAAEAIARPRKLSDIVAPPATYQSDAEAPPPRQKPREKKKKVRHDERKIKNLSDGTVRKITSFWMRKPLPSLSHRAIRGVPHVTLPGLPRVKFDVKLNNAAVLKAILASLIGVSFLVSIITFYLILPRSKIYISPATEKVSIDLKIRGDTNVIALEDGGDSVGRVVPSQIFEKSLRVSKTAASRGEKDVREKATGVIKVYNSYSSSPQTLVQTTRFVSESGKVFRTIATIVVPGAEVRDGEIVPSSTMVSVIAQDAGREYNIGPSTFSIPGFKGTPKYLAFYGKSEKSMGGGEIGKVKVISEDDYKNLEKQVTSELSSQSSTALLTLLPEGFLIPQGAKYTGQIQIDSSGKVGDSAAEFTITGSVLTKAFAVRESDIKKMLANDFAARFPNMRRNVGKEEIIYEAIDSRFEKGILEMKVSLSHDASAIIDKQKIIEGVRGKTEAEVRSFLSSFASIREARVTFWPFWVSKIPDDLNKIEIIVEGEGEGN